MLALDSGDKIQGDASTAAKVDYTLHGLDANAIKQLADGQLADATGDLYAADSADVVATITLCNTDSSAITVNLYLLPSGGTARRLIPKDCTLGVGYSLHTDGKGVVVMSPSAGALAAYAAHKDSHDPNDGADPLDTAAAGEIVGVAAAAEGTAHSFARSDHTHQVQASIADDHIVTIDDADAADDQVCVFTASGIEGVTVGISDNNMVAVDGADIADDEYARFTASGLESRTASEVYTDLLAQTLLENDAIKLDSALSDDGKYNGITRAGVAGATLAFGDIVYYASADDRWELADADAAATTQGAIGVCVLAAASDGDPTNILLIGIVRAATFPAFTKGAPVFLSTTDGDCSSTAPAKATGDCVRVLGQAWSAEDLWFCPSADWYEYA